MRYSPLQYVFTPFVYCLTGLLFAGCATTHSDYSPTPTVISTAESQYIFQRGENNVIAQKKITWQKDDSLALVPSSPYVYQTKKMENPPVDIATHNQIAYLINRVNDKNHLLILKFPETGKVNTISDTPLGRNVKKIYYSNNRLLMTNTSGGIDILDVSNPELPVTVSHFPTSKTVTDIQFDGQSAYLLLENRSLIKITFTGKSPKKLKVSNSGEWTLPFSANSIATREGYVWIAGNQGIGVIKLNNQDVKLIDRTETSGNPTRIQLYKNFALVTDGKGGLVVYDIKSREQLLWKGSYNKRGPIKQISISNPIPDSHSPFNNKIIATFENESIMSVGLNNPELPSSGPVYKSAGHIISSILLGDDVLLLTRNVIQRIKMVSSTTNTISPEGVNLGGSRRGVIRDNILYVADWFSGLHLYDISIPQQPRHLSNYHTPGSSKGVTLFGDYVLVGDDDQGLQIIDIENPRKPIWVSELAPDAMARQGLAYTMKRVGKTLYLADHRGGFHIIDLTDVYHPKRLGGYDTPGKSWGIDVKKNYVFVADDQSGLLVFNASDPANPQMLGQFDPGGQAEDVAIQGNRAYVAFFDKGLYVLDIQDPAHPVVVGHTPIPGNARGIELGDGLAYVAGWESGLHIVDTHGPNTPRIIGSFDTDGSTWGINVRDGYAYVLDWWGGIKVIDVRQPSKPSYVGQYHARGTLKQLRARNRYLYAASGAGGLQVFDIKNPLNPIWLIGIDMDGQAQDIWHDESRAYVAAGDGGVILLDTVDPFYTRRIGQIDTPGEALQVRAWNDYLFIRDSRAGIIVVDARNPQRPEEIDRFPMNPRDLWVDEKAFWISTEQGITWWTHQDGYQWGHYHQHNIAGGSDWVRTTDQMVITAKREGLIEFWQPSLGGLKKLGAYTAGEAVLDIKTQGNLVYVLGASSGLMVINIQDPASPYLTTVYPSTGLHTSFEIANGSAFFSGENKIASVSLLPPLTRHYTQSGELGLKLPPDLPIGNYHLLKISPNGQKQLFTNALHIQYSRPGKTMTPLERYRLLLKKHP